VTTKKTSRPCPGCKFPNIEGSKVCLQCGQVLVTAAPLAWLHCESFDPKPLTPGKTYTMGRDSGCDLVLPHKTLSRTHAVISVGAETIDFEDRSSNGSSVNGKRVKTAVLSVGDVVQLGPFELEVRADCHSPGEDAGSGTMVMDFKARITGHLEHEPLMTTIQGLEFNSRTGTLEVLSGRSKGVFVVGEGKPWSAELTGGGADKKDDEAVLAMLLLKEGRFVFTASGSPTGDRRMHGTITGLLLEHSRRTDENGAATAHG
jgi:hypothetical protein